MENEELGTRTIPFERELYIDSTLGGMGKGAGNLETEMLVEYLNKKFYKGYNESMIVNLYEKNQEYAQRQEVLQRELEEADEEQQRLQQYEEYTKSPQYIEDLAKSKLGLVHENEIVFKEEKGN